MEICLFFISVFLFFIWLKVWDVSSYIKDIAMELKKMNERRNDGR